MTSRAALFRFSNSGRVHVPNHHDGPCTVLRPMGEGKLVELWVRAAQGVYVSVRFEGMSRNILDDAVPGEYPFASPHAAELGSFECGLEVMVDNQSGATAHLCVQAFWI